jgi:hypothetical protein
MSPLFAYKGKLLVVDGKLAANERCCCDKCLGTIGTLITFDEFPIGTAITDQYKLQGIIFGGDNPFITTDGGNPTSPVLSGTPRFFGNIRGSFVDPNDGATPIGLKSFSLDAGFFDQIGETTLEWYDENNNLIDSITNTIIGIETFNITIKENEPCIFSWFIKSSAEEAAGFAIDNVSF